MARPKIHDAELRDRLLDRTARIVGSVGVVGLSLRTLAASEATSTSAIYSLFGGKAGLLGALFDAANRSFGDGQRAVPITDDPMTDLLELGRAYREWALSHPHLYQVIFGGALAGFQPTAEQFERARSTIEPLNRAVARAISVGKLAGPPELVALSAWSTVHGLVTLNLDCDVDVSSDAGLETFEAVLMAAMRGWSVG